MPALKALRAFSAYGIELEYMIVDSDSLAVRPIADQLLAKALSNSENKPANFDLSNELVLHLIEIKNDPPHASFAGIAPGFQCEIARLNGLLAEFGARLMPGAMHPWMNPGTETRLWPHLDASIYRSYDRIFDCRTHGWANLQSMHLNLPFGDDAEFARLHAAVRLLLPILPALAASSPVANGGARTELDFRMACYRNHPARVPTLIGKVIPDNAASRAEYESTVLAPMYWAIAPFDPDGLMRHEWLNARGAIARFDRNALEIRVIDTQECPQADLAIAGLTSAVARLLYDGRWAPLAAQQGIATGALAEILGVCVRDADRALIDDAHYLGLLGFPHPRCEAHELWRHLWAECSLAEGLAQGLATSGADPLLTPSSHVALENILSRGPLARRILRALGKDFDPPRLAAVYRELCDCLAAGRLFNGAGA